jgi:hypothetical protein
MLSRAPVASRSAAAWASAREAASDSSMKQAMCS